MIQGGDVEKRDGTGAQSIYGGEYEDENLQWRDIDARGLVCSANSGKDTNGSQFFVTLEPSPHLNGLHTVFGRLVAGEDCLEKVAKVEVDNDDKPRQMVLISKCGELERRKKKPAPAAESVPAPAEKENGEAQGDGVKAATATAKASTDTDEAYDSHDRGRKRKSDDSDREAEDDGAVKARRTEHQRSRRRRSDNIVDEGLRGRPKLRSHDGSPSRSHSLSNSQAAEEDASPREEASDRDSPVARHARRRSPSPSRRDDRRDASADGNGRRRRSLPNQYQNNRSRRGEDRYRPDRDDRHGEDRYRPNDSRGQRRGEDRYRPGEDHDGGGWRRPDHDRPKKPRGGPGDPYGDMTRAEIFGAEWDRPPRYGNKQKIRMDEGRLGKVDDGRLGGPSMGDGDGLKMEYKGRGNMRYREH